MEIFRLLIGASLLGLAFGVSAQSAVRMHVPFLPDTPGTWQTFVRLVGAPSVSTRFTFRLFSSDGTSVGQYVFRVPRTSLGAARHVSGDHFKALGAPRGPWSAFIDMSPRGRTTPAVYLRTGAGFVTPIHNTGEWLSEAQVRPFSDLLGARVVYGEYQWTMNPGRNTQQVGILHLAALGRPLEVFILAVDDTGERIAEARTGVIPAFARRAYTSAEMEAVAGMAGVGKWRLVLLGTGHFSSQTGIWAQDVNIYAASSPQTNNTWPVTASSASAAAMEDSVPVGELTAVPGDLSSRYVKVLPPPGSSPVGRHSGMPSGRAAASSEEAGFDDLSAAVLGALEGVDPEDFPVLEPL